MAKIIVQGSETSVTIIEREDRADGETEYYLECDKGVWCPVRPRARDYPFFTVADAVAEAMVHVDYIMHA